MVGDDSGILVSPLQRHLLTLVFMMFIHTSLLDVLVCPFTETLHISEILKDVGIHLGQSTFIFSGDVFRYSQVNIRN